MIPVYEDIQAPELMWKEKIPARKKGTKFRKLKIQSTKKPINTCVQITFLKSGKS